MRTTKPCRADGCAATMIDDDDGDDASVVTMVAAFCHVLCSYLLVAVDDDTVRLEAGAAPEANND